MIREAKESDIGGLNGLPPPDWKFDYEALLKEFINEDFFYAFIKIQNNTIVATGNIFFKDKVGWLANIMVDKEYRGKGLGNEMAKFIIDYLDDKKCNSQLLLATEMGERIYQDLGFKKTTTYLGYQSETDINHSMHGNIRQLIESDLESILTLDQEINAEDREHFLVNNYELGFGYFDNKGELIGFYLPYFGRGLVLAKNPEAGIELLKIKHSESGRISYIPIENKAGIDFFTNSNFKRLENFSRMILNKESKWKPKYIYSYGSGYSG